MSEYYIAWIIIIVFLLLVLPMFIGSITELSYVKSIILICMTIAVCVAGVSTLLIVIWAFIEVIRGT